MHLLYESAPGGATGYPDSLRQSSLGQNTPRLLYAFLCSLKYWSYQRMKQ